MINPECNRNSITLISRDIICKTWNVSAFKILIDINKVNNFEQWLLKTVDENLIITSLGTIIHYYYSNVYNKRKTVFTKKPLRLLLITPTIIKQKNIALSLVIIESRNLQKKKNITLRMYITALIGYHIYSMITILNTNVKALRCISIAQINPL